MVQISLEERIALQDVVVNYCYAVDKLADVEELLDLFTDDAVLDFSGIGLPLMSGRAEYKKFYDDVFADMTHHTHYASNFRITAYDGDTATVCAYVQGMGRARDGNEVHVHVRYTMECTKSGDGWKCRKYLINPGMPLPGSMEEIHGNR